MFKKVFKKRRRQQLPPPPPPPPSQPPPPPPPPPPPSPPRAPPSPPHEAPIPPEEQPQEKPQLTFPFLFPKAQSNILPDPSLFFAPSLLSSPLPTHSFFQNFTLKSGDQPEYIHPYLIKSSFGSSISVSYPSQISTSSSQQQIFIPDLTISASNNKINPHDTPKSHVISSFSDLTVTLDLPSSNLRFFLARGSPYLTCSITENSSIFISTIHAIISLSSNSSQTKHTIKLNNGQIWFLYSSSQINLSHNLLSITSDGFSGVIKIAILPDNSNPKHEAILDRFSSCYALSGDATFTKPYCVEYNWEKKGSGDLIILAHPLHIKLLSNDNVIVLNDFKYKSIDGDLIGVIGDSWVLKTDPIAITWHSSKGIKEESFPEIVSALQKDVEGLSSLIDPPNSCYLYGKMIARAARLALIAEEIRSLEVIPAITKFLKEKIEPWLDGTFSGNGFVYEDKWRGIVTKLGLNDSSEDFGFGIYNAHYHSIGYFLYAIAALAKLDAIWGKKYKLQAYSLMADIMNLNRQSNSNYPRLRCFDLYKLHSWGSGLVEFADGRNQDNTSEAVNAYYSAALMGLAYGDTQLVSIGSTLAGMEIYAAQTWCHVRENNGNLYGEEFTKENRVVGVSWANKRDSGLWFAPAEWRECRAGIQILPLLPVTEIIFSDVGFVKELVKWALPGLEREGAGEEWKGFVYALEGIYDKESGLEKIRKLNVHHDGNSLTNMLWWIHSRGSEEEKEEADGKLCWFSYYCH
ncbi:glucan endo-1,3-beta-D-glucosidase ARB_01444-like [Mercurialis annua]|uniref:glucan endo-1,3-beta-D-glucosidase ARB_01444-like n=1 Tax=Mercurialis annua TaxID=3986 RepID=UPI00215F42B3|nr:glucan endo-1,3-beta-D-glucosidase ARB_01444-like [Mercurialis annua]